MSNLMPSPDPLECDVAAVSAPSVKAYPARSADLGGGFVVRRALPQTGRRLVGPWCFLDHFGPLSFNAGKPMDVAPHPHIGLQTVTWLIEGEALHKDSLSHEQLIRPGHHQGRLPILTFGTCRAILVIGELDGVRSPAQTYSPTVAVELAADRDGLTAVPLAASFEHAIMPLVGHVELDDRALARGTLYYLGTGREQLSLKLRAGARLMLIGGEPFGERILLWWNFVARTPEEIAKARSDWEQDHRRFGDVRAYVGRRLPAPPLTLHLQPPR